MAGRIIGCLCSLLCALPFWLIPKFSKDGKDPISFWSSDRSLKEKVTNVPEYNREMAALYTKYAWSYAVAGVGFLLHPLAGVAVIVLDCTVGIVLVYRTYKKILGKYS